MIISFSGSLPFTRLVFGRACMDKRDREREREREMDTAAAAAVFVHIQTFSGIQWPSEGAIERSAECTGWTCGRQTIEEWGSKYVSHEWFLVFAIRYPKLLARPVIQFNSLSIRIIRHLRVCQGELYPHARLLAHKTQRCVTQFRMKNIRYKSNVCFYIRQERGWENDPAAAQAHTHTHTQLPWQSFCYWRYSYYSLAIRLNFAQPGWTWEGGEKLAVLRTIE